jgi:hypothetical protein
MWSGAHRGRAFIDASSIRRWSGHNIGASICHLKLTTAPDFAFMECRDFSRVQPMSFSFNHVEPTEPEPAHIETGRLIAERGIPVDTRRQFRRFKQRVLQDRQTD